MKPAPTAVRRSPLRLVLALLLATAFAALTVAPAQAAAYRYWGFYQLTDGKWAFAQKGSDQITPADGAVDGWRFAVGDASASRLPRAVVGFEQICSKTPAQAGKKRVGLVIDFGRTADSSDAASPPPPKATCAVVAPAANSTEVLKTTGELRTEKGLVCGVAGYPATGCGGEVKNLTAAVKAPDTPVTLVLPNSSATSSAAASATPGATTNPPAAGAPATATTSTSGSSAGTSIAYLIAALALVALGIFLVLRTRAARKHADKHV